MVWDDDGYVVVWGGFDGYLCVGYYVGVFQLCDQVDVVLNVFGKLVDDDCDW